MVGGLGARTLIQACYFILIARSLGPSEYGAFIATTALIGIMAPFASWGAGNILVKHVARDAATFPVYWGAAFSTVLIASTAITLLVIGTYKLFLPATLTQGLVLAICLSDLLFANLVNISAQAFQAVEKISRTAQIHVQFSIIRLAMVMLFLILPVARTAPEWSYLYLASSAIAALVSCYLVWRELGWGPLNPKPVYCEFQEGANFSLIIASQTINNGFTAKARATPIL